MGMSRAEAMAIIHSDRQKLEDSKNNVMKNTREMDLANCNGWTTMESASAEIQSAITQLSNALLELDIQ